MARKKRKRGKQGIASKLMNAGLILLGFSRVLEVLFDPRFGKLPAKLAKIKEEATFGLSEGRFNFKQGLRMYTPAGAAIGLGQLKSYLLKKFPVR